MQNSSIIESLEIAITAMEQLRDAGQMPLDFAKHAITDLQLLRVGHMCTAHRLQQLADETGDMLIARDILRRTTENSGCTDPTCFPCDCI